MRKAHQFIVFGSLVALAGSAQAFPVPSDRLAPLAQAIQVEETVVDEQGLKQSKKFVANMTDRAINFLSDETITPERRVYLFKELLLDSFDMETIARFSLGRYWRVADKGQRDEYLKLFEDMILRIYSGRFQEYQGQKVDVTGSRPNGPKDWIVSSVVVPTDEGPSINVEWRVRRKEGQFKVIDIIVEGVSMGVTQRSDFASVIQRGGGDLEVLLAHLRNGED